MTGLSPETLAALAPAPGFKLVDRFLPAPYRRALYDKKTPMAVVTRASRDTLTRALFDLEQVQKSRSVNFFTDLNDGSALGALHDQKPWPEEDTEAFRARLRMISVLALQGAASARRMLSLLALATGSELIASTAFNPDSPAYAKVQNGVRYSGTIALGQYRGLFEKPNGGPVFAGDVLDAPLRPYRQPASLLPQQTYVFTLNNPSFISIPDMIGSEARRYPDPIFDIEVEQPLGPFLLVQVDPARLNHAPRVIVVNRKMRAGSRLTIEPATMRWSHKDSPIKTTRAWITVKVEKDSLYAGLSEIASAQSLFDNEAPAAPAAGYAMDIRTKTELEWTGLLVDQMIDQGAILQGAALKMPALLADGTTRWHLIEVIPPADPAQTDIQFARFRPVQKTENIKITARWHGRRAGEFALRYEDKMLAPDQSGPLAHRAIWLEDMLARFKLAGTILVPVTPFDPLTDEFTPEIELDLQSALRASDVFALDGGPSFVSDVTVSDTIELLPEQTVELQSMVALADSVTVTSLSPDLALASEATTSDSFTLLSEVEVKFGSDVLLTDTLSVEDIGVELVFGSEVTLGDKWEIFPEANAAFFSATKLTDAVSVEIKPRERPPLEVLQFQSRVSTKDSLTIKT